MEYTMRGRIRRIMRECLNSNETDHVNVFYKIACMDFVRTHGPEYHFSDDAVYVKGSGKSCVNRRTEML